MKTICKLIDGEKESGVERINLDVKFLRGDKDGKILTSGKHVSINSLLILVDGENSGEVFRSPIDGYQGSTLKILDIHPCMNKEYVLQVIKMYQKTFRDSKTGSAIPHLNKKLFKEIIVPVPPYSQQNKIVQIINQIMTNLNTISDML